MRALWWTTCAAHRAEMTAGRDGSVCEVSGGGEARPALPAKVSVSCYQVRKLHGARAKLHGACKLIRIINRVGLMIPTQTPFQKCILASRVLGLRLAGRNIWICTMVSSADQPSSSQAKLITQRHSRSALAQKRSVQATQADHSQHSRSADHEPGSIPSRY